MKKTTLLLIMIAFMATGLHASEAVEDEGFFGDDAIFVGEDDIGSSSGAQNRRLQLQDQYAAVRNLPNQVGQKAISHASASVEKEISRQIDLRMTELESQLPMMIERIVLAILSGAGNLAGRAYEGTKSRAQSLWNRVRGY